MSTIRVPKDVATSPQDGSELRFDTDSRLFRDENGNQWSVLDMARNRPGNKVRKWVEENYPQITGSTEQ